MYVIKDELDNFGDQFEKLNRFLCLKDQIRIRIWYYNSGCGSDVAKSSGSDRIRIHRLVLIWFQLSPQTVIRTNEGENTRRLRKRFCKNYV
jgi:hypothetical protein